MTAVMDKPSAPPTVGAPEIEATAFDVEERVRYLQGMVNCVTMPDSRATFVVTPKGAVPSKLFGYMVPVYCANCGFQGPLCPQNNMTFMFWLCRKCEHHGHLDGCYMEPDQQYWAKIELEELNTHGRWLTAEERFSVAQADSTPLATLLKEGR